VQWAINPADGRMVVIEMNPRVSRSSALASKATGFPIAKIAAKLAVGYTLDELDNDITKVTPASFEPTIDYVVTKIRASPSRSSRPNRTDHRDEVGGRGDGHRPHLPRILQKALASLETGLTGFDEIAIPGAPDRAAVIEEALRRRLTGCADRPGHAAGMSDDEINAATAFDPWFRPIREIVEAEAHSPRRPAGIGRRLAQAEDDGLHRRPACQADRRDEAQVRRARSVWA
jgi:carbamoyl-phosphate synthase large subunit